MNKNRKKSNFQSIKQNRALAFWTSRLDAILDLGRSKSLWPMSFGTACCNLEVLSAFEMGSSEELRFSPTESDLLLVSGTIVSKMVPYLKETYNEMLSPKYVISIGACASSGGIFQSYSTVEGVDRILPVDVYVPGCPPSPVAILEGVELLRKMIESGVHRKSCFQSNPSEES